ncbi:hypothetical protein VCHC64A1_03704A, partial [Vibrio cholerae HC-64A1]
MLGGG